MGKHYFTLLFVALTYSSFAQSVNKVQQKDTARRLDTVTVKAYLSAQPAISVPASVIVLDKTQLRAQPDNSFVNALNTVAGVRAEERSPGSYRLSIRGSLLRSPFGVRDVKMYLDDIPLTDAGGNTYLNTIDIASLQNIEILKGPDGSLFGANTGGVVLLGTANGRVTGTRLSAGVNGGSYGLFHEKAALQTGAGNNSFNFSQSYQNYNGYRQNSATHRNYLQAGDTYRYGKGNEIRAIALYSNLYYQTPGGLTLSQYNTDPTLARLPTKTLPGAVDQKTSISTKILLGGLTNEAHITGRLRNVVSVFTNHVDFANPFITNYEQRSENTYGLRTYFELSSLPETSIKWKANLGLEWQQTNAFIGNYGNNRGVKDTTQRTDRINTNQHFIFARYAADLFQRLHAEAALSLNYYSYRFRNIFPLNEAQFTARDFTPQLMPRLALSYQLSSDFIWRASVSRGYSTPTTAEVRPTDNIINTGLQAQYGWNKETGFRLRNQDETFLLDATVFFYNINNAIVRRLNPDETEYYLNAGGTDQHGYEAALTYWPIRRNTSGFIRGLQLNSSLTISRFNFEGYNVAGTSYSGNRLTGVPRQVVVSSVQINLPQYFSVFVQHNYTSAIPLNDANTVYAGKYNLLQGKFSWQHLLGHKLRMELFAGADNILNEKYSLGNDLNAVGSRYFNASPLRNYNFGASVVL